MRELYVSEEVIEVGFRIIFERDVTGSGSVGGFAFMAILLATALGQLVLPLSSHIRSGALNFCRASEIGRWIGISAPCAGARSALWPLDAPFAWPTNPRSCRCSEKQRYPYDQACQDD
jgi:hypothetical protein